MRNETQVWAEGKINSVAKDIIANGGLGTSAERVIEEIAQAVISDNFLFQKIGRRLKGSGARTNIITHSTRKGWRPTNKNNWLTYGFNQAPSFLTENLVVKERIETSLEWNKADMMNTERGLNKLIDILKSALLIELPIEFEKMFILKLVDVAENGKTLISDDILGNEADYPVALPYVIETDFTNTNKTIESISKMIELSNRMGQQENPLLYRPTKDKWMWVLNVDTHSAIQSAGGFKEFIGDAAWKRALNNDQVDMLNGIPVLVSNSLEQDQPWYLVPRPNADLGNTQMWYMNTPDNFFVREAFQGESASNMFYKMESSEFAINISYWATKMGLMGVGKNTMKHKLAITDYHLPDGKAVVNYEALTEVASIVLIDQNYIETDLGAPVVDGTAQTIELADLATGTYMVQMRDVNGFNLSTSISFYVINNTITTGTNQETSGDYAKKVSVKHQSKAEAKLEEVQEAKKLLEQAE